MKNTTLFGIIAMIVLLLGIWMFTNSSDNVSTNNVQQDIIQGETQKVVLSQSGFNYKDSTVKAGKPITISADNSVTGCLRSVLFNIEGKKYLKYLQTSDDILQLPALSKGTYTFSCSMG